jgi:DNA-binding NarL/FixJ family response regulator/uncharacterized protein involved in exopolysaccharide biosynthesis
MINILIVDDQQVVREALKLNLSAEKDFKIVDTAVNSIDALDKIKKWQPDVVLMDIEMPGGISGLEMTGLISSLYPQTKTIVLSSHYTQEYGQLAVRAGAEAYLPKTTPTEQIAEAIRKVSSRQYIAAASVADLPEAFNSSSTLIGYEHPSYYLRETEIADSNGTLYREEKTEKLPSIDKYLKIGAIANILVWLLALAYLKFAPPSYTSKWGVKTIESDSGVELILPDGGKASSAPKAWEPPSTQDLRNDYVYIFSSPDVLKGAANLLKMEEDDFGEPIVTVDEENGIIAFEIDGKTPDEAQQKAIAFNQIVDQKIAKLRDKELIRQEGKNQTTLEQSRAKLTAAQRRLSEYQAKSGIDSDQQVQNLTENLENLRRQRSELLAQQKGIGSRYERLGIDIQALASPEAGDSYKLLADSVYKQQLKQYAIAKSSLTDLLHRFTPEHPSVQEKQKELARMEGALETQASSVLDRSVSVNTLAKIAPLALDPQTVLVREDLQKDLVTNRAEWQKLAAQNEELTEQIAQLESRLRNMSQEKIQIDNLKRDVQVAEAVFASTLAKLDLNQESIYSVYPPLQLVNEPDLPDEPSNPNPTSVFLGGLAGSFLVTTGLALLWFDNKKFRFDPNLAEKQLPSSSISII